MGVPQPPRPIQPLATVSILSMARIPPQKYPFSASFRVSFRYRFRTPTKNDFLRLLGFPVLQSLALNPPFIIAGIKREGWKGGRVGCCTYFILSRLAPITHASHTRVPASRQLGIEVSHRTTLAPVGSAWPCELRVSVDGASRRRMHTWETGSLNTCRERSHSC